MRLFRRKRDQSAHDAEQIARPEPKPDPVPAANRGPSWMPAQDWEDRLTRYRTQGRSDADIAGIAAHLERRGPRKPPKPAERIARAKSHGLVARDEYLNPEEEAEALAHGADGLPDVRLERIRDRLLVVTPRGWINPRSRTAATRAGLWSFGVRGAAHHESAARRGDFRPGKPVRLVREPANPHDPNAIAVYADGARNLAGYVPKGYAKRLARLLDAGADMVAISTRGSGPGREGVSPQVLVCERALYEHMTRKR